MKVPYNHFPKLSETQSTLGYHQFPSNEIHRQKSKKDEYCEETCPSEHLSNNLLQDCANDLVGYATNQTGNLHFKETKTHGTIERSFTTQVSPYSPSHPDNPFIHPQYYEGNSDQRMDHRETEPISEAYDTSWNALPYSETEYYSQKSYSTIEYVSTYTTGEFMHYTCQEQDSKSNYHDGYSSDSSNYYMSECSSDNSPYRCCSIDELQPLDLSTRKSIMTDYTHYDLMCNDNNTIDRDSPPLSLSESNLENSETDNLWLKKIKTGTRSRVRSPKSWEFLLRLLQDPNSNPSMIRWEEEQTGTFRLVRKDEIARIWGMRSNKHKKGGLSYDNFARNLRYHYKTKMMIPVSEKHLVYRFGIDIMERLKGGTMPV